ncbi:MAG: hypothetical protein IPM63_02255 [Acidobacteriota bacterium]|nr:MAG: hypothetical protein IPM63_02255 [Acidobacteriota bacterium]
MKKTKAKIKVIRKKDLSSDETSVKTEQESGKKSARRIVSNVSSWVNDIQRRKRAETKEALDKLFPAKPQTDSA